MTHAGMREPLPGIDEPDSTRFTSSTRQYGPKRSSTRCQSSCSARARIRWMTSPPSYRSRSMTNAFDQSISSAGASSTSTPSTSPRGALSNQPGPRRDAVADWRR
jgi:hypothetical protein